MEIAFEDWKYPCSKCGEPTADEPQDLCPTCLKIRLAELAAQEEVVRMRARDANARRRAIYAAGKIPSTFGMLFRFDLAERDGSNCGICGDPLDPLRSHVDHIIPISRGGLHEWENVRLTHPVCNMQKGNRT